MQPADRPRARLDFLGVRAGVHGIFGILVVVVVTLGARRGNFVGCVRIDETDDKILHPGFAAQHRVGDVEQHVGGRRKLRHVIFDLVQAVLDALGDFDLTLARQELDRTHFTHVHAHRVGRAAELGVNTGQRRLGFFGGIVVVGYRGIGQQQRFGIRRLLVHRDTHVVDHVDDVFDLLGIDDIVRQVVVDLGIGQETLLLAARNQILELLRLLATAYGCTFLAQDETSSKSKKCKRSSIVFRLGSIQKNSLLRLFVITAEIPPPEVCQRCHGPAQRNCRSSAFSSSLR